MQVPVHDFVKMARRYTGEELLSRRKFKPDDIASYFHITGTTRTPKLAQHTHFNEVIDAWAVAETISLSADHKIFCGLPLFDVNGVIVTGLIPWMIGASVVLGSPSGYRDEGVVHNFWQIVDFYKINFFSGVPTLYSSLLDVPVGEADISSLELTICGSVPMPVELFRQFEDRTKVRILEGYGLTEGACVSSINPLAGEKRVGSIGLRLPYQEMMIVKLDREGIFQKECDTHEIGLIILRGPNIFTGYKDEMHNRKVWVDTGDGQGLWFNRETWAGRMTGLFLAHRQGKRAGIEDFYTQFHEKARTHIKGASWLNTIFSLSKP